MFNRKRNQTGQIADKYNLRSVKYRYLRTNAKKYWFTMVDTYSKNRNRLPEDIQTAPRV